MARSSPRSHIIQPAIALQASGEIKAATDAEIAKRRQSSSCDQCRQGKRGCDASRTVLVADQAGDHADAIGFGTISARKRARCSYCRRTGKDCTFNWLESVYRKAHGKHSRSNLHSNRSRRNRIPVASIDEVEKGILIAEDVPSLSSDVSIAEKDMIRLETFKGGMSDTSDELSGSADLDIPSDLCHRDVRSSITQNLMRVYQDSMENALDCWLTEYNCPYTTFPHSRAPAGPSQSSCRILQRVCKFDNEVGRSLMLRISPADQKRASKALRLAMMAFATQWAQSGQREAASYVLERSESPLSRDTRGLNPPGLFQDDSFGRSMQETVWHQARAALLDADSIVSGRVTFAFIIFSLTQRPLGLNDGCTATESNVNSLLELEGAPVFLDSALRQLSSMKRLLHRTFPRNAATVCSSSTLDKENQQTFDLLFWLGVMFDTLSAAMHDRAVVVADEDCDSAVAQRIDGDVDLDGWNDHADNPSRARLPGLWESRMLEEEAGKTPVSWPCHISTAEQVLRDAAPVKVLFFRRLGRLQASVSRDAPERVLERSIDECLLVYSYWQSRFQPFMNSCLVYHEDLSPKLQSWYGILAGHWHLCGMIFAEVVEEVDVGHFSCPTKRLARLQSSFIHHWRLEHSFAISNLAEAALREERPSFRHSPSFHDALNKSALLSEPWTAVLTRSFSKAATFLLDITSATCQLESLPDIERRARRCIEALMLIGKKSDIAMLVADELQNRLAEFRVR